MMRVRNNSDSGVSSDSSVSNNVAPHEYHSLSLQEKIKYLKEKIIAIRSAQELFLENYSIANSKIEKMSQSLLAAILYGEMSAKNHLEDLKRLKIQDWERQLRICRETKGKLRNAPDNFFEAIDYVQTVTDSFFKRIGPIDGEWIDFYLDGRKLLEDLSRFGKLLTSNTFSPIKVTPRFILRGKKRRQGRLSQPWGVCGDLTGQILVVDSKNNRIQLFNELGEFLFSFGKSGNRPGEFNHPTGIAVDKKSRILVSDKNNHRIQVFSFTGNLLFTFGERGVREGQFLYPWDVAVNDSCEIAVSDSENYRIQLFDPFGAFIAVFGFTNSPILRICPRGIAFRPDGDLLVTDFNNHMVVLLGKNFLGMTTVREFKPQNSYFFQPQGISCDARGLFAIADGTNTVQVYDEYGYLQRSLGPGDFDKVQGVCLLPDGGIAVADAGNNRVQVF